MKRRGFIKTIFAGCGALACSSTLGFESFNNNGQLYLNQNESKNIIEIRYPDCVYVIFEDGKRLDLIGRNGSYSNGDVEVAARLSKKRPQYVS